MGRAGKSVDRATSTHRMRARSSSFSSFSSFSSPPPPPRPLPVHLREGGQHSTAANATGQRLHPNPKGTKGGPFCFFCASAAEQQHTHPEFFAPGVDGRGNPFRTPPAVRVCVGARGARARHVVKVGGKAAGRGRI